MGNRSVYLITLAFFCAFFFIPRATLAKELCVVYDVKSKQISETKNGEKQEKDSNSQLTVGLGDSYFYVASGGRKSVFDFRKKRIFEIDDAKKVYSDISLFYNIGFRYMEFQNRLFIRDVLQKALEKSKADSPSYDEIFDIESLFGIVIPNSTEQPIMENKRGDNYDYTLNNQIVVECKFSSNPLTEQEGALFEKYLIYMCYLHPKIRKKIIAKKQVPQYLRYTIKTIPGTISTEMNLVKVITEQRDSYVILSDYVKVYSITNKVLASIVNDVMSGKSSVKRLAREDFYKIADELQAKGNYFDAMLSILEYSLQTGDSASEKMREIISAADDKDERLRTFSQIPNPKDKESALEALKAHHSINREGLTHGYIIDIMIGDIEMMTGGSNKAKESFLNVLKENPYIAGVYKDLGDVFNSSYDTVSAWQCWDIARFLYPDHKIMQQINEYEKWLVDNFPDFFLSE